MTILKFFQTNYVKIIQQSATPTQYINNQHIENIDK